MKIVVREARIEDVAALVDMMRRAHADGGFALDVELAQAAFSALLSDRSRGVAWIGLRDSKPEGYIVVTFKLSMESGGIDAFIEDIFVERTARRTGVGTALVSSALAECRRTRVFALHVETGADNESTKAFYSKCGLKNRDRTILTCVLRDNPLARPL